MTDSPLELKDIRAPSSGASKDPDERTANETENLDFVLN